jgi:hypothetical protein
MVSTVEWLFSQIPVRFPDIRICISEGGIGWVPGLLDRLDHMFAGYGPRYPEWSTLDVSPSEVLRRNFWFCALDDTSTMPLVARIGSDHVVIEVDYPHADSSWPDCQQHFSHQLAHASEDEKRRLTWQNASELFGHPVPVDVQRSPDAF